MAADPEARRALVDEQAGDAPRLGPRWIGAYKHAKHGAVLGVGDEHLRAVDDPLVLFSTCRGTQRRRVRTRIRFSQCHTRMPCARGHLRQVRLALCVSTEVQNHPRRHHVSAKNAREAHPPDRELLHQDGVAHLVEPAATVLLRDGEAKKAQRPHLLDDGGGIAVLQLIRHSDRPDLSVHERLHHLADALLHLVELEIHRVPPRRALARRYPMMPLSRRAAISLSSMPSSRSTAAVSAPVLGGCARRGASPLKRTGKRPRRMRP